jgi:quercetin dioxygenase-like cupin family protein
MEIKQLGNRRKRPTEYFTGNVRLDSPFKQSEPARVSGAIVTFEPGARTVWYTHPLGQTLIVTSGCGWIQSWGNPKKKSGRGTFILCVRGKHWHGATATMP